MSIIITDTDQTVTPHRQTNTRLLEDMFPADLVTLAMLLRDNSTNKHTQEVTQWSQCNDNLSTELVTLITQNTHIPQLGW